MDSITRALVLAAIAIFAPADPVLEIGSLQVGEGESSDLRPFFRGRRFVGCDMMAGPGVDRIERLEALSFPDGWAGTVLCLNVFEHAWDFRGGAREIHRVTAPGGFALVVAPFEFHIHSYPEDYWRFTPRAIERLLEPFDTVLYGWQGHPRTPRIVFGLGLKSTPPNPAELAAAWKQKILDSWDESPSLKQRFRAAVGGALFGKRGFRMTNHWRDIAVQVSSKPPTM